MGKSIWKIHGKIHGKSGFEFPFARLSTSTPVTALTLLTAGLGAKDTPRGFYDLWVAANEIHHYLFS